MRPTSISRFFGPCLALLSGCAQLVPLDAPADAGADAAVAAAVAAAACPSGVRPTLAECAAHDGLTAHCGGTSDHDVYACTDSVCRLFAGGCVARGYDSVVCDVTGAACEFGPDDNSLEYLWRGHFPRSFGWAAAPLDAAYVLDLNATTPSSPSPATITCPAGSPVASHCWGTSPVLAGVQVPFIDAEPGTRVIGANSGFGYWGFVIDRTPPSAPTASARICAWYTDDLVASGLQPTVELRQRSCATSGTVTWDGVGPGHAEFVLEGRSWAIDF